MKYVCTASAIMSFLEATLKVLMMQRKTKKRLWHRPVAVVVLLLVHSAVIRYTLALPTYNI